MAKILSHPRVYSFLHVPVQSASDNVLADMKREYSVDDFMHVVDFLKERWESVFVTSLHLASTAFPVLTILLDNPGDCFPGLQIRV